MLPAFLISTPFFAPWPVPTIMTSGLRGQGHRAGDYQDRDCGDDRIGERAEDEPNCEGDNGDNDDRRDEIG